MRHYWVKLPQASLAMTESPRMPPTVAEVQPLTFMIITAILITFDIIGGLAFMQQQPLKQPQLTVGMGQHLVPTVLILDSKHKIV